MSSKVDVLILDRMRPGTEELELVKLLEKRGISSRVVDWQRLNFSGNPPSVELGRESLGLPSAAALRSRVLTRHTEGDVALLYDWLEMFESMGVAVINTLASVRKSQNKVYSASLLAKAGIPVPLTRAVRSVEDIGRCVREWEDVVLKPVYGHASVDMTRMRQDPTDEDSLEEEVIAWSLLKRHHVLCAQRFIPNPGRDLRVLVIRGRVVSGQYRIARSPDHRVRDLINPYRAKPAALTSQVGEIATRSCETLGLECASIDMVEGPEGVVVIEVNPTISIWRNLNEQAGSDGVTVGELYADMVVDAVERAKPVETTGNAANHAR